MKTIELKICVNHIRACRGSYINEEELRHRICDGRNPNCEEYKPYNQNMQIPITKGVVYYNLR